MNQRRLSASVMGIRQLNRLEEIKDSTNYPYCWEVWNRDDDTFDKYHHDWFWQCEQELKDAVELLDTFCSVLATGNGDTYAATLDTNGSVVLIVAKNGHPTQDDMEYVQNLCDELKSAWNTLERLLTIIIPRCKSRINRCIAELHDIVESVLSDNYVEKLLLDYKPREKKSEFPCFRFYREIKYKDASDEDLPPIPDIIRQLFRDIFDWTSSPASEENPAKFIELGVAVGSLLESRFLDWLQDETIFDSLLASLEDINVYCGRIKTLKYHFWRCHPELRWAVSTRDEEGQAIRLPRQYMGIFEQCAPAESSRESIEQQLLTRFPGFPEQWSATCQNAIIPQLHPEIRLILEFIPQHIMSTSHPIGSSEPVCRYCRIWIEGFNCPCSSTWRGMRYAKELPVDWALPSLYLQHPWVVSAENNVVSDIKCTLEDRLQRLEGPDMSPDDSGPGIDAMRSESPEMSSDEMCSGIAAMELVSCLIPPERISFTCRKCSNPHTYVGATLIPVAFDIEEFGPRTVVVCIPLLLYKFAVRNQSITPRLK